MEPAPLQSQHGRHFFVTCRLLPVLIQIVPFDHSAKFHRYQKKRCAPFYLASFHSSKISYIIGEPEQPCWHRPHPASLVDVLGTSCVITAYKVRLILVGITCLRSQVPKLQEGKTASR